MNQQTFRGDQTDMSPPSTAMSSMTLSTEQSTVSSCGGLSTASGVESLTTGPTTQDPSTQIADAIWTYLAPIIFFIGLIGNILILVVTCQKRMRGTSTADYLIIMAVADLLTIITGMIPEWLDSTELFHLQESHPAACKIYKFLNYASGDTATWIRVLFTLDRFMAICFPMHKPDCCLPKRAKFYCLGAALAAIAKNMHVFWTRGAQYTTKPVYETIDCVLVKTNMTKTVLYLNCGYPTPEYEHFEVYVRPWIVFVLVNLIPFCIILICNIFIIRAMIIMKRSQTEQLTSTAKGTHRNLLQTTAMCLAASFTFLITITPTMVLLIGKPYWKPPNTKNMAYDISKSISNQLLYVNNSVNIFLYCITGKKFRETLVMVLCCRWSEAQKKGDHSARTSTARVFNQTRRRTVSSSLNSDDRKLSNSSSGPSRKTSLDSRQESQASDKVMHGIQLEMIEELVFEDEPSDVIMENGFEPKKDTGENPAKMVVWSTEVDENLNKSSGTSGGHTRTGSESSSGISSSTSREAHPELNETSFQEIDPTDVDCSAGQKLPGEESSLTEQLTTKGHLPAAGDSVTDQSAGGETSASERQQCRSDVVGGIDDSESVISHGSDSAEPHRTKDELNTSEDDMGMPTRCNETQASNSNSPQTETSQINFGGCPGDSDSDELVPPSLPSVALSGLNHEYNSGDGSSTSGFHENGRESLNDDVSRLKHSDEAEDSLAHIETNWVVFDDQTYSNC